VIRGILAGVLATFSLATQAIDGPYDERADAPSDVQQALQAAKSNHRNVLLVFGANWCGDCRVLDKALHGTSQPLVDGKFNVVKIDVGNFDKNLDLSKRYGNPIAKGIPAVVIVSPDNQVIYSTKGGELADARKMGDQGIYDFLAQKVSTTAQVAGTH
jgi:thioredoxin 1